MTLFAQWIWGAGDPAPRNVLMQFRRAFQLGAMPAQALLHISADSRYLLYVNGARIGYGPARSYHFNYRYDSYDLVPHLRAGENVIAAAVSHWGEGTFLQRVGRGGLMAQLKVDGQVHLSSDASWRARPSAAMRQNTPRISPQLPWEEQVDARLEDAGWADAGFDDAAWAPAHVIGPVGCEPWGNLSPRTIPFLTDEPLPPVRAFSLGRAQRPAAMAALHANPYVAPGDLTSNRFEVDVLAATVLRVPQAGQVTLKRCTGYYDKPPRFFIDGQEFEWRPAQADLDAVLTLSAGDHALLVDWQVRTHDVDITLTASGQDGLDMTSPLPGDAGRWAIAVAPGAARPAAYAAATPQALLACGANWQPVLPIDTPDADAYMDLTASTMLEADERAARFPLRAAPAPAGQARHFLVDFGRQVIGWIELDVDASAGTAMDILGFEGVQEGRRLMAETMNNSMRYVCRDGRQTFISTLRRGFRYLIVAVHGNAAEAILHHIGVRLSTYPGSAQGSFRCADPRLNQIWDMCAYTLRLCSEDTFTDCPTYEQTLWTGDACHSSILMHMTVHGDPRLPRRCLLLVADSLQRLPIAGSQVPGDWENDILPNWSWLWAMGCASYYELTGDAEFARQVYPAMAQQAAVIENGRNAAGILFLPGYWHFLDWTKIPDGPDDIMAHESCLAVAALNATALVAQVAGQEADAARWRKAADELAAAINREFWLEDRQAYADSWRGGAAGHVVSQPTNICAVLSGVAGPERTAALGQRLLVCPDGWIASGTPWMHSLACMVLAERGQMAPALASIRDRWGDMLDKGATTAWELFSGWQPNGVWTRSWCHAWSAMPGYLLPAFVLGVRPLEPGFKRALIAPQPGDLTWAEAKVPTPHGLIETRIERDGAGWAMHVSLPAGVSAEVRLPAGLARSASVTGALAAAERQGDVFVADLPAGSHARIVTA